MSHRHGYVTPADFVRGRYDDRGLSLAVALTGFVATMPYTALQLVGIQAVRRLGRHLRRSRGQDGDDQSGHGGAHGVLHPRRRSFLGLRDIRPRLGDGAVHVSHSVTASLSSDSRNTVHRNAAILPAYSFVLGLLALLGWVAIAAGTQPVGADGEPNPQLVIPQVFEDQFPSWFAGVAFAAVAIGALVPAAIMSIARPRGARRPHPRRAALPIRAQLGDERWWWSGW